MPPVISLRCQITQFRIDDFNVSIPSCAGELGRGKERTEVADGFCPAPGQYVATSPKSRLATAQLLPAVPPSVSGVMSDAVPSLSDGSCAVSRAGVVAAALPPRSQRRGGLPWGSRGGLCLGRRMRLHQKCLHVLPQHQQEILPSCIPTASAGNITWRYYMGYRHIRMKFRIISAADLPAEFCFMGTASFPEILKLHLNNNITLHRLEDLVQGCWLWGCHSDITLQILHSKDQHDRICKQYRTKLQAKPPIGNAHAIKLCPSQHCFKVQATLQVQFNFFCVNGFKFNHFNSSLIQDPAHKINYTHFAMASCDLFMVLVCVYWYEGRV